MTDQAKKKRQVELTVLIAGSLMFAAAITFGSMKKATVDDSMVGSFPTRAESESVSESQNQDYSHFQHSNPVHARMPCLLCHKRDDNSATPKLPGHTPCSGCHTQQFGDSGSQICTICHTNVQTGTTKRFPGLRSFTARFDHARHIRQTDCATCHRPSRRGVALSIPSGIGAHGTCYQCHGPRTEVGGKNIGSCNVCHTAGRPIRNSDWAGAFAKNFDHSKHHRGLNCTSCHIVRAGRPRGGQVTAPLASMHFASGRTQSCATCHNNKRVFGGNDFADCKRCHEGTSFRF